MSGKSKKTIDQRIAKRATLDNFTKGKKWSKPIKVSELIEAIKDNNNSKTFSEVLGDDAKNPGCYKWWAEKEYVEKLLNKIFDNEKLKTKFSETEFDQIFEKIRSVAYPFH